MSLASPPLSEEMHARVEALVNKLKPLLAGEHPVVQSAALAEALALWLCGHPDFIREAMLSAQVEYVRLLVPAFEQALFQGFGHPQNKRHWSKQE